MTYNLIDTAEIKNALSWLSKYRGQTIYPEYYSVETIDRAVSLYRQYGKEARIIAGGIDLISLIKNKLISPAALINIKNVPNLKYIAADTSGVSIGALTHLNDIENSDLIKSRYSILSESAHSVGSPQIRNMATIGGNLCQEVRCWYYRRSPDTGITFNCRRKIQDGICYALDGENQYHSIFGFNECCAVHPSDIAVALSALDASINTVSTDGGRMIPVDKLYTKLGNILEPGEVITSIQIPKVESGAKQRFLKFRLRKTIDFAIVSVATVITLKGKTVRNTRMTLGGVAPVPYRAEKAEQALIGREITFDIAEKVAEAAVSEALLLGKNGYKIPIVKALVKRVLLE